MSNIAPCHKIYLINLYTASHIKRVSQNGVDEKCKVDLQKDRLTAINSFQRNVPKEYAVLYRLELINSNKEEFV